MPTCNLACDSDRIDPLASFRVLAVMCHPGDVRARERMLATIQVGTGIGQKRRAGFGKEAFYRDARNQWRRAFLAGGLLLTLIQLQENGIRSSLNLSIRQIQPLLEPWNRREGFEWSADCHISHLPTSRRKVLVAFTDFLPVSHLWAAFIHGMQHGRDDIWPRANETIPRFLAYAEAFAAKGARNKWPGRDRRFTLDRRKLWRCHIPEHLRETRDLMALPLTDAQRAVLNEHADT